MLATPQYLDGVTTAAMAEMAAAIQAYADHVTRLSQDFRSRLETHDRPGAAMERAFGKALRILTDLDAHLPTLRQTIISINDTTSYPRFVDQLNEDLLRVVFETATADQIADERLEEEENWKVRTTKVTYFPEIVTRVSKRWRGVALASPELWTYIKIDRRHPPEWTERCIASSRTSPLRIHWSFWLPSPSSFTPASALFTDFSREVRALVPHLGRIKKLSIDLPSHPPTDFMSTIVSPMTRLGQLETLALRLQCRPKDLPDPSEVNISNLRVLQVRNWTGIQGCPVKDLMTLQVHDMSLSRWDALIAILSFSPNVKKLSLRHVHFDEESEAPEQVLELNELRALDLGEGSQFLLQPLLDAIKAPHLRSVTLRSVWLEDIDFTPFVLAVLPTLEILELHHMHLPHSALLTIFNAAPPMLHTFALHNLDTSPIHWSEVPGDVIEALNKCRRLSSLTLYDISFDFGHLLSMLRARGKQPDLIPIVELTLTGPQLEMLPLVRSELENLGVRRILSL